MRLFTNFLYHLIIGGDNWRPLLGVHYLTYACSFRCPYCSDGAQNPYYALRETPLNAIQNLEILRRVRQHCDHVVLTGGEPLQHPEISEILQGLPALKFKSVTFTTNGFELKKHLEALKGGVTDLVVSLDSLDEIKSDACFGKGSGTFKRILNALEAARQVSGLRIHISAVVRPENLDDLPELYRWSQAQGFRFAACPQLMGKKAHPDLPGDPRYQAFYDLLLVEKRKGGQIFGGTKYLEHMRDLKAFKCRPFTMLVTSPQGNVFYPCLERGSFAGNILEESDLRKLGQRGLEAQGPRGKCPVQCHSACALGFATALDHPLRALLDEWRDYWNDPHRSSRTGRTIRP